MSRPRRAAAQPKPQFDTLSFASSESDDGFWQPRVSKHDPKLPKDNRNSIRQGDESAVGTIVPDENLYRRPNRPIMPPSYSTAPPKASRVKPRYDLGRGTKPVNNTQEARKRGGEERRLSTKMKMGMNVQAKKQRVQKQNPASPAAAHQLHSFASLVRMDQDDVEDGPMHSPTLTSPNWENAASPMTLAQSEFQEPAPNVSTLVEDQEIGRGCETLNACTSPEPLRSQQLDDAVKLEAHDSEPSIESRLEPSQFPFPMPTPDRKPPMGPGFRRARWGPPTNFNPKPYLHLPQPQQDPPGPPQAPSNPAASPPNGGLFARAADSAEHFAAAGQDFARVLRLLAASVNDVAREDE